MEGKHNLVERKVIGETFFFQVGENLFVSPFSFWLEHCTGDMAFQLRKSKFRHVFGKPLKRDQCYDGVRITRTTWDYSTFCSVNPKYIAVMSESGGGGAFIVLPLNKVGRVERDAPVVAGHKAAVLDLEWCPHNDDVIASASEDCTVKVWQIPEGGLKVNLTECAADLVAHQRRVGLVKWHPSALNILVSAGSDNKIFVWNAGTSEALLEISVPDQILSASFNYNGSKLVTTCKDKMMRVFNPRTGEVLAETKAHEGSKGSQAVFAKDGKIFTTGFSRMGERQYALWDEKSIKSPLTLEEIDQSNGVLFPYYDGDTGMVYLCGKEFIYDFYRIYKLHNNGLVEVIPFTVPRKSELFQSDLYPDTPGDTPAITADDWFAGKNADPILISLQQENATAAPKVQVAVVKKSNVLDKPVGVAAASQQQQQQQQTSAPPPAQTSKPTPVVNSSDSTARQSTDVSQAAAAAAPALPPGFDPQAILDDMRKLKLIVKAHEKRIKTLEEKLSQYEANTSEEEGNDQQC
ncbi:hypothetical protein KUTeg_009856 [Tegillarca granosa]|uniref:Coronin n=1 Tax=Tegillarca granosa TaxID=220873 RepID=A0ABQ9F525_TEGGR|nr:hypothetical protein KUTeg_009856 [Tegillarca granosa]